MLTEVTEARKQATNIQLPPDILTNPEAMKKFQDAQATLGGALGRLMAVVERYPDIKSGQNFLALQSELAGTENRIAIARRDYIEAVKAYNTEITTFPGRLWKTALYPQAKEMATFDIPAEEQKVPKVDFSKPVALAACNFLTGTRPMAGAAIAARSLALRRRASRVAHRAARCARGAVRIFRARRNRDRSADIS